jgi:hypothetical protein
MRSSMIVSSPSGAAPSAGWAGATPAGAYGGSRSRPAARP